ncbi:TniQ family protein [Rhizobium leguminosarum]|uniref:TniQ family protein n=1 Tax=Rhizobium leguminosarum TaxID=384 RepID=UPI0013EEC6CC|nr:TniQ family protein [Rhizobium leguminosarum]
MTRLSRTVVVHEDEHAMSVVARLAASRDQRLDDFCRHLGIDLRGVAGGRDEALRELAYLANVDISALKRRSLIRHDGFLAMGDERMLPINFGYYPARYCPHCLAEDRAHGSGPLKSRPYGRLSWLVSFVSSCPIHEVGLLVAKVKGLELHWIGSEFSLDELDASTDRKMAPRAEYTEFERYVCSRMAGGRKSEDSFLDELPLHVAGSLCELVGAVLTHGRVYGKAGDNFAAMRQLGFGTLHRSGTPLKEFFRELAVERRSKNKVSTARTLHRHVYRLLKAGMKHPDFDGVREIFREASIEELPLGPGDNVFGPIEARRFHSLWTAYREFGISPSYLGKMLEEDGIISNYDPRLPACATIVPEHIMISFIERKRNPFDSLKAREYLGVTHAVFERLLALKLLAPLSHSSKRRAAEPLYDSQDTKSLLLRLRGDATSTPAPDAFVDILEVRAAAGCTLEEVLDLLTSRALSRVHFDESKRGLLSILVDPREVREIVEKRSPNIVPVEFAHPNLGPIAIRDIWRLVDAGHLTNMDVPHHINGKPWSVLTAWSVELFEERYASLDKLAARLLTDARLLRRELEAEGVAPFLNNPRPERALYEVAEVARLKLGEALR